MNVKKVSAAALMGFTWFVVVVWSVELLSTFERPPAMFCERDRVTAENTVVYVETLENAPTLEISRCRKVEDGWVVIEWGPGEGADAEVDNRATVVTLVKAGMNLQVGGVCLGMVRRD